MADYGFRLTRDACGKHSVPETIDRSWRMEDLRQKMSQMVKEELAKLSDKGVEAVAIEDPESGVIEIHEKFDNRLISYYEIEEFEQR